MKLQTNYKLIGKKKFATVEYPISKVAEIFTDALKKNSDGALQGKFNKSSGLFKIFYKISDKNDYYENYCLLAELKAIDENTTQIQYCFVYDRLLSWYTRILSIVCFAISGAASAIAYFKAGISNPIFHAVLLIIAAFGIISLFAYKEKQSDVEPVIDQFENLLLGAFSGESVEATTEE